MTSLLYPDDTVFLSSCGEGRLQNLHSIGVFEMVLWLKVNFRKKLLVGINVAHDRLNILEQVMP